jgi:vitamin B12 transporter
MRKYAFLLWLGAFSLRTHAQQTDTAKFRQMNEVIVTADKSPGKLSQTGKLVTVISREQIEKSGGKSLSQILNEQAGILVAGANSNPGLNKTIYLEGAGSGYTLVLMDGVPLFDASSVDNSFDLRNLTLEDIDHIEIVKGSQSVLYGSDAIAGVINIITKKGADKPISLSSQASYGSNNTIQAGASVGGKVSTLTYNAGYAFYHTDGISEATDTVPGTPSPRDGYTQHSVYAHLGWQAARGLTISPFFRYSHYDGREDGGAFAIDTEYTYQLSNLQAGLQAVLNAGKGQIHLVYSYNRAYRKDVDDSLPTLADRGNYYSDAYTGYEHYSEAYLSYPLGDRLHLVAGVDYRNLSTDQRSLDLYPDFTTPGQVDTSATALGKDSTRYHQVGVYAAATLKLPAGIYIDGGIRYNNNSKYGDDEVFNIDPSITIAGRWKLFVNVSSGYKIPSLYQLYSPYGNQDLKPEQSLSYEGGLQYTHPSGKFRVRGTLFDRDLTNVIFFDAASQYINQNKEHDRGLELETDWTPCPRFTLNAHYMFVTGDVTDKSGAGGKDTTYFDLLRIPKNSAGLTLGYQVTKALYLSSGLQWEDKRLDLYYDYNTYADAQTTLHAYWLWNAYGEYALLHGHMHVFLDAHNITGTSYMEIYGYNTLGFTFTGGVRYRL